MTEAKAKSLRSAGMVFLVLAIVVASWFVLRPNALTRGASDMAFALRDGDGAALYSFAIDEERKCSNLTPDVLRKAWEILIQPRIQGSRFVRIEAPQQSVNETQATAEIWYVDGKGKPWRLLMIANQAEGGPKATVLIHMLLTAPLTDVQEKTTGDTTLKKVRAYRAELEAIGIRRVMLNPTQCLTWDQLETKIDRD